MLEKNNLNDDDIKVLKFLSKYKMLKVEDASLIYKTKRYYRARINRLINTKYVKRYKNYIIIDKNGRKVLNEVGTSYIKNIKNESYMERLRNIASIASITIDSNIEFIPSWDIKEKDRYTETARRYIGKMYIDQIEYLVYYISEKKEHIYLKQLLFDINKSLNYKNVIIFLENFNAISKNYSYLSFGKDNTLAILNSSINKELIKKYEKIDMHEILETVYEQEIMISNWDYADYLLVDGRYIINMLFLNTERVSKLNWFFKENTESKKKVEVITIKENELKLKELLNSKCYIKVIDKRLLGGLGEEETN